jgi:hypothetical protein
VVNTPAIPIGGKGWLEIGMGNGYMPQKMRQQYDELFGLIGTYGIKLLIDQNLGMNVLPLCKSVAALDAKYNLAEIVMSVAARKLTNKVNFVLRAGGDREARVAAMDAVLSAA